ncbi:MAG: xanthine dehydrogenase family protein subunit M [Dehalococcoidia bacterium]|nr:xanthine dehydrogenase family protein subunit M [Dehalococcoidia bacterium]MDW8119659.1 xanthine dehydrogenase family protein subunit M [Chloroflexota bacterium]
MRPFDYKAPKRLQEAYAILSQANGGPVRPLAGGTDLIDQLRVGRKQAAIVMDVKHIPELQRLEYDPRKGLLIGAAVPCYRVYENPAVSQHYPAIREGAMLIGSWQIQHRASLGGNICNAAPSADTVPPLLVYEAVALIGGPRGERQVPLERFFTGPGQTVLGPDEILLGIQVPPAPPRSRSRYQRFIPREEMDIAVAGAASLVAVDEQGVIRRARIALAAVAPTPVRAHEAEALLEGQRPTRTLLEQAGEKAVLATKPITDVRGSIGYRKELVKVLTRRTLVQALADLGIHLD